MSLRVLITYTIFLFIFIFKVDATIFHKLDDGKALVSNSSKENPTNTVSIINLETKQVLDTITVGENPSFSAMTPDGKKAIISNTGTKANPGNTVSVVDLEAKVVIKTVTVGVYPMNVTVGKNDRAIVFHRPSRYADRSNHDADYEDSISIIDLNTYEVTERHFPGDRFGFPDKGRYDRKHRRGHESEGKKRYR